MDKETFDKLMAKLIESGQQVCAEILALSPTQRMASELKQLEGAETR